MIASSIVRRTIWWDRVLAAVFVVVGSWSILVALIEPGLIGSHAVVYTDAARAWLTGGDPWAVGPPMVVFSGPPLMLLPFAPFTLLPIEATRYGWVALDAVLAVATLRRLGMPAYWLAFPPLVEATVLGHPEVAVLALLVLGGSTLSGLAALVKVYACLPLIAERRWRGLALAAGVVVVTVPILPWGTFMAELPLVQANLARQSVGDSVFGQPLLMAAGVAALAALGLRRALWLAVPVLWPFAQPIYKTLSIPALSPVLALAWALPFPGATLAGVVVLAVLVQLDRARRLPAWLRPGIGAVADWPPAASLTAGPGVAGARAAA